MIRWITIALVALCASAVAVGGWALVAPRSFYDDFPASGHNWVAADGPFNEHLVRDVGALLLALAVVTGVAAVRPSPVLVRTASIAWLVYSIPHLAYHLRHLDLYDTADQIANGVTLALPVVVSAFTLFAAPRARERPTSPVRPSG